MSFKVIEMTNSLVVKQEPQGYLVARFYGIKKELVEKIASIMEEG